MRTKRHYTAIDRFGKFHTGCESIERVKQLAKSYGTAFTLWTGESHLETSKVAGHVLPNGSVKKGW